MCGVAELKKALHAVFSQFGKVLDVVSLKTFRLRGQVSALTPLIRSVGSPASRKTLVD